MSEEIKIPFSKKKLKVAFVACLVLMLIGRLMMVYKFKWVNINTLSMVFGLASIIIFGIIAIFLLRKISDDKPALIINQEGIIDNTSVGVMIPWDDIVEIKNVLMMDQHFLLIMLKEPQAYIDKVKNLFVSNRIEKNHDTYGTPICLSSSALKTDFISLKSLLIEKFNAKKE